MKDGFSVDSGAVKTTKLTEPCEDKTCFEKYISNGALEQCTVCGKVRDGEVIRRLEAQLDESEAAINRIGQNLERLTNLIIALKLPEQIVPSSVIIDQDELTEEEEEKLTKPQIN